jgi:hypothetical protein
MYSKRAHHTMAAMVESRHEGSYSPFWVDLTVEHPVVPVPKRSGEAWMPTLHVWATADRFGNKQKKFVW